MPRAVVALRAVLLLLATLLTVTLGARAHPILPDLVLPIVVAGALLVGPSRGALLGLGAGWLADLMPPGSAVLGTSALLYAAAGLLAGAGRREGETPWGWVSLVSAASAALVVGGRVVVAALSGAPVEWGVTGAGFLLTAALGGFTVPLLVSVEQGLCRWSAR